jgi:hypothetical protein
MATLDAATYILPRPAAPRRNFGRRRTPVVPAAPRNAALRRRGIHQPLAPLSGERIDTLLLQGMIVLAMAGMLLFFHAPLLQALHSLF